MAKKIASKTGKLQYVQIREIAFTYLIPDDIEFPEENEDTIQFDMEIVKMLSQEEEMIRLIFTINLKVEVKDKKEAKSTYSTEHLFKVGNFSELVKRTDDHFEVNEALDKTITGLAYSTIRGLFLQRFKGTWFSDFILPITKPSELRG